MNVKSRTPLATKMPATAAVTAVSAAAKCAFVAAARVANAARMSAITNDGTHRPATAASAPSGPAKRSPSMTATFTAFAPGSA
jgi:hypothetical protein